MRSRRSRSPLIKLHQATIRSHRPAGRGYYRLVLKAPHVAEAAQPGQFVMLRVTADNDPLLARPFGICSVPSKSSIEILYRVVGKGTTMLTRMKVGQELSLLGPLGNGFILPDKTVTPVLVAGGSGFPPLNFLSLRAGRRAHVFVGARHKHCLPPVSVLDTLKDHTAKVYIATEDGSSGQQGMSTEILNSFLSKMEKKTHLVLYACGPHGMLAEVNRIAAEHSITCYVSVEERMACGLGACMGCSVPVKSGGYKRACQEGPVFDSREILWGEQVMLQLRSSTTGVRSY
jgi:dihydroorotate dehydrogenase electron transfer subunit